MLDTRTVGFRKLDFVHILPREGAQTEVFVADLEFINRRLGTAAIEQHQYGGRNQTLDAYPGRTHQRVDLNGYTEFFLKFALQAILDRLVTS